MATTSKTFIRKTVWCSSGSLIQRSFSSIPYHAWSTSLCWIFVPYLVWLEGVCCSIHSSQVFVCYIWVNILSFMSSKLSSAPYLIRRFEIECAILHISSFVQIFVCLCLWLLQKWRHIVMILQWDIALTGTSCIFYILA